MIRRLNGNCFIGLVQLGLWLCRTRLMREDLQLLDYGKNAAFTAMLITAMVKLTCSYVTLARHRQDCRATTGATPTGAVQNELCAGLLRLTISGSVSDRHVTVLNAR